MSDPSPLARDLAAVTAAAGQQAQALVPPARPVDFERDLEADYRLCLSLGTIPSTDEVFFDTQTGWASVIRLAAAQRAIIAQHDLCHNLHGQVGPREFTDGCSAEQRRLYGCAPDADEVQRLRALLATARQLVQVDILDRLDSEDYQSRDMRRAYQRAWQWLEVSKDA